MTSQKPLVDLFELSDQIGAPFKPHLLPNGIEVQEPIWDNTLYYKALDWLSAYRDQPDTILLLTNSPAPWITMGLLHDLKPLKVNYLYPRKGGVELEMPKLQRGVQENNCDVKFEVIEQDGKIFINMTSDRPEAADTGKHTFRTENLPEVMIPEIPGGKDVFIHAKGMFCVMVCVGLNYIEDAKSVSIAWHQEDYHCGYSADPSRPIGAVEKCVLKNNL